MCKINTRENRIFKVCFSKEKIGTYRHPKNFTNHLSTSIFLRKSVLLLREKSIKVRWEGDFTLLIVLVSTHGLWVHKKKQV